MRLTHRSGPPRKRLTAPSMRNPALHITLAMLAPGHRHAPPLQPAHRRAGRTGGHEIPPGDGSSARFTQKQAPDRRKCELQLKC